MISTIKVTASMATFAVIFLCGTSSATCCYNCEEKIDESCQEVKLRTVDKIDVCLNLLCIRDVAKNKEIKFKSHSDRLRIFQFIKDYLEKNTEKDTCIKNIYEKKYMLTQFATVKCVETAMGKYLQKECSHLINHFEDPEDDWSTDEEGSENKEDEEGSEEEDSENEDEDEEGSDQNEESETEEESEEHLEIEDQTGKLFWHFIDTFFLAPTFAKERPEINLKYAAIPEDDKMGQWGILKPAVEHKKLCKAAEEERKVLLEENEEWKKKLARDEVAQQAGFLSRQKYAAEAKANRIKIEASPLMKALQEEFRIEDQRKAEEDSKFPDYVNRRSRPTKRLGGQEKLATMKRDLLNQMETQKQKQFCEEFYRELMNASSKEVDKVIEKYNRIEEYNDFRINMFADELLTGSRTKSSSD